MNALRRDFPTLTDRQLQSQLERQLAARKAAQHVIDQRIATKRSEFRANAKAPPQIVRNEPVKPARETFGWVDSYIFLTPLAIVSALILAARWLGWLV